MMQDPLNIEPDTREVTMPAAKIEPLVKAWRDKGRNPAYHDRMKSKLKREWPALYKALDLLVEGGENR